jgi:hypothetical protein
MGSIKLIIGLAVIVGAVYLGAELIPPYFANYEFEDAVKNEAMINTYNTKPEDLIREELFRRAQDLDIPVTKEQIKVHRTGSTGTGSLTIETRYTVHVDLPGYPLDLQFEPSTRNKSPF